MLGLGRHSQLAGWGMQNPKFDTNLMFGANFVPSLAKTSVYSQSDSMPITNDAGGLWGPATVNLASASSWTTNSMTVIHCLKFPSGFFNEAIPSGTGTIFYHDDYYTEYGTIGFENILCIGKGPSSTSPGNNVLVFNMFGSGQTNGIYGFDSGTVLPSAIENRWISICVSVGPRTGFSNYNTNAGTNTTGMRVYIRDAETSELLYARDMQSFNYGTSMPDWSAMSGLTASNQFGAEPNDWFVNTSNFNNGNSWTGNVYTVGYWQANGGFIDPALTDLWVGASIPTTIDGVTAWYHATGDSVDQRTSPDVTLLSCSPTQLVEDPYDQFLHAGGTGTDQWGVSTTEYPH